MYALTIDDHGADVITLHDTPAAARATLHTYLEMADYTYRPAQLTVVHTAYELFANDDDPHTVVGVATIEPYTELDVQRDLNAAFGAAAARSAAIAS